MNKVKNLFSKKSQAPASAAAEKAENDEVAELRARVYLMQIQMRNLDATIKRQNIVIQDLRATNVTKSPVKVVQKDSEKVTSPSTTAVTSPATTRTQPIVTPAPADPVACKDVPSSGSTGRRSMSVGSIGGASFGGGSFGGGGGGCFLGSCTVLKADGTLSLISSIVAGDRLACSTDGNTSATVLCVLVTHIISGQTRMVAFPNGLCVTPGHPVLLGGVWVRPKDILCPTLIKCDYYYNFLFEQGTGSAVVVNGTPCVSLGHGMKGDMREHAFWGSWEALANTMQAADMEGFKKGKVIIELIEDGLTENYTSKSAPGVVDVALEKMRIASVCA